MIVLSSTLLSHSELGRDFIQEFDSRILKLGNAFCSPTHNWSYLPGSIRDFNRRVRGRGDNAVDSHVAYRFCGHGVFIANKYIPLGTGYFYIVYATGFHPRSDFADAYTNFQHRNDH